MMVNSCIIAVSNKIWNIKFGNKTCSGELFVCIRRGQMGSV